MSVHGVPMSFPFLYTRINESFIFRAAIGGGFGAAWLEVDVDEADDGFMNSSSSLTGWYSNCSK